MAVVCATAAFAVFDDVRAADATLTIYVVDANAPKVLAGEMSLQGDTSEQTGATTFKIPLNDRLVSPILLKVTPTDPQANFYPLRVETPITWSNKTYVVRLKPTKASGTSDDVRTIYSKRIQSSDEQLPILYHQARRIASVRIEQLDETWHRLHDYDVQAVFKYLEIVRELNKRYIIPADDISQFRSWLQNASDQSPRRVDKAVGLTNAHQLLREIESMQGTRFIALWKYVANPDVPCIRRGPLLRAFLKQFRGLASDEERAVTSEAMQLTEGHMLSGIVQCEAIRARCAPEADVPQIIRDLAILIEEIENVRPSERNADVISFLERDKAGLVNLQNSLSNSEPRVCSDSRLWSSQP